MDVSVFEKTKSLTIVKELYNCPMDFTLLLYNVKCSPRTLQDRIRELQQNNIVVVERSDVFPFKSLIYLTDEGKRISKLIKKIEG